MSAESQRLARKIVGVARDQAEGRHSVLRAVVVRRAPLRVELVSADLVLDVDDDFDMTALLRFYHREFGVAVGDTLLLQHEEGTYIAFDVVSDNKLRKKLVKA